MFIGALLTVTESQKHKCPPKEQLSSPNWTDSVEDRAHRLGFRLDPSPGQGLRRK